MLRWAAIFLVIAVIAALFGFTGIAGAAADLNPQDPLAVAGAQISRDNLLGRHDARA